MNHRARHHGFTLIELITVMVIICVVLAMAAPSLQGWSRGSKLRDAGDQFLAVARYAQTQAVSEARIYRLQVDAKAGRYWLAAQDGTELVEPATDFGRPYDVPEGFRLEMTDLGGQPLELVDFYPTGRCQAARVRIIDREYVAMVECVSPTEGFALAKPGGAQ
jgi:type II secretion system protein H